jgi:hypothetical protein
MPWFRVDDGWHSHPKVVALPMAARGLWITAGTWSADQLTDGYVPRAMLRLWGATSRHADELIAKKLWTPAEPDGFQFHDWSVYQPTSDEAKAKRDSESMGGRLGNHRRWHAGKGVTDPNCPFCERSGTRSGGRIGYPSGGRFAPESSRPDPSRPDPKSEWSPTPGESPAPAEPVDNRPPLDPETAEGARLALAPVCPHHGEKWQGKDGSWNCTGCVSDEKAGVA